MTKIAHLSDRIVLRLSGPDARDFLQGQLTNDVAALAPGRPLWAGLLSPQGKALFDMVLHDAGDAVLADVAVERAEALARRLAMFRLRRAVEIAPAPDACVFAAWDGAAGDYPADPRLAALGQRWIAPAASTNAGSGDWHRHRRALGVPDSADFGVDAVMWLETNAVELNGVSFTKGCYVGQENTARMHHRDRLRKRILPVRLSAESGGATAIMAGEREAGTLMSHSGGDGFALMRLEFAGPGIALMLNNAPVNLLWPGWLPPLAA